MPEVVAAHFSVADSYGFHIAGAVGLYYFNPLSGIFLQGYGFIRIVSIVIINESSELLNSQGFGCCFKGFRA